MGSGQSLPGPMRLAHLCPQPPTPLSSVKGIHSHSRKYRDGGWSAQWGHHKIHSYSLTICALRPGFFLCPAGGRAGGGGPLPHPSMRSLPSPQLASLAPPSSILTSPHPLRWALAGKPSSPQPPRTPVISNSPQDSLELSSSRQLR